MRFPALEADRARAPPRLWRIAYATRLDKPCYIASMLVSPRDLRAALRGESARRGRILAIKWGMNPNSSSLGVDVTFLLVGSTVLAMVTPLVGALLRLRGRGGDKPDVPA